MEAIPHGTVTFLFTDVQGSTRLWEQQPEPTRTAVALHDEILRAVIDAHDGYVFSTGGDAFSAAFWTPAAAIEAAVEGQRRLSQVSWPAGCHLTVRMGVHTGTADERDGNYFGSTLNRGARLMSASHGGQIVVSAAAQRLVPVGGSRSWGLTELGEFRLRDLAAPEVVFQVVGEGLAVSFPPLRSLSARLHNLPLQTTSFVGRDALVSDVMEMVGVHRLVTLVGGGGFGKTRVALQVAAELVDEYEGVYFVELAALRDVAQMVSRVIESMGYVAAGMSPDAVDDTLIDRVAERPILLVLDNCEHLVEEGARVVQLLLTRCPQVRLLATSRQPLGVPGERLHPVGGLDVPASTANPVEIAQSESGALFVDRARAARPNFNISATNAMAVGTICRLVEGLPLALELAAARVRAMGPDDILTRLRSSLRVLSTPARVGDGRHRTLEACLAWSFDALGTDEAAVLRRCSVFAGGLTLAACGSVCAGDDLDVLDVEDHLVTLVDRSLVQVEDGAEGVRYGLHELVRQFAAARLSDAGEADGIRTRHLEWCVGLVQRYSPGVRSLTTLASVEPLLAEADNLSVAVAWAMEQKHVVALVRILGGGGEMWAHVNKMRQLGDWWNAALPLLPDAPNDLFPPNRLGLSLLSASAALGNNGRYTAALDLADRALRLDGLTPDAAAFGRWLHLSWRLFTGSDPLTLAEPFQTLVEHTTEFGLGIEYGARHQLALIHVLTGSTRQAEAVLSGMLDSAPPETLTMLGPITLALQGVVDVVAGRVSQGLAMLDDVAQRAETHTTHWRYLVLTLDTMGRLLAGQAEDCLPSARRSLVATYESSMFWCVVYAVEVTALLSARLGEGQLALEALTSLDRELSAYAGLPFSAHPSTILFPIRQELLGGVALDNRGARAASVLDMSQRLRHHLAHMLGEPPV